MKDTLLCFDCKRFNPKDRVFNCYIANSIIEFCKNHKIDVFIVKCKEFDKKTNIEIVEFKEGK